MSINIKSQIVKILIQNNCFKYDPNSRIHTEHIGKENHFIDCNNLLSSKNYTDFIKVCQIMSDEIKKKKWSYDKIGGIPIPGALIAYEIAKIQNKPYISVKGENGNMKLEKIKDFITGEISDMEKVLLIDDVSASGESILNATNFLIEANLNPKYSFSLYDKNLDTKEKLSRIGITHDNIISVGEFIDIALNEKLISKSIGKDILRKNLEIKKFFKNNDTPFKQKQDTINVFRIHPNEILMSMKENKFFNLTKDKKISEEESINLYKKLLNYITIKAKEKNINFTEKAKEAIANTILSAMEETSNVMKSAK